MLKSFGKPRPQSVVCRDIRTLVTVGLVGGNSRKSG
jgi:hypothetical protein